VSSKISNGPIILNVDCDMYSNNSNSIQNALCFFMDEEKGHEISFEQFPQSFENATKNKLYGSLRVNGVVKFHYLDGYGGPWYVGSGCFHRRDTLYGEFSKEVRICLESACPGKIEENVHELEERLERLASSTYEENTQWGNEVSSRWFLPFAYFIIAELICSFAKFLWSGGAILGWWNELRMWLYKRTTSYFFAFLDVMLKLLGISNSTFIVTPKVSDEDVLLRYK
ncbi:hypothetical protein HAX54_049149, partial [Datura stramonium]|nr:hypothetical protein [Datura stramonium]